MPARDKWWNDVIKSDTARHYAKPGRAKRDDGSGKEPGGQIRTFIWGDRVRVLAKDGVARKVSGRGGEAWVHKRHLGGEPLLEVYVIDVGQGDGLLVVTPEGHNIMVDGGNIRALQNGGKNAADFVDWKFTRDYVSVKHRNDPSKAAIQLDALIASHNDIDHFGGLSDLVNLDDPKNAAELNAKSVSVETIYHAGLSWWFDGFSGKKRKRTLGKPVSGNYTKLLGKRKSAVAAVKNLVKPDKNTLHGAWGRFIKAATRTKKKSGAPTKIERISDKQFDYLPGFEPNGTDKCSIRVLGPIETTIQGKPGLKVFPDGTSKNTNGHSVVLRLDYRDRRILLTGDLNTHSQNQIMDRYGADFVKEFMVDVAKGCHHGSHDVSYRFLEGLRPIATVISSGDAETHDHPRPTIVSASAITGRRLVDTINDKMIAPLVYMTEVARSISISKIGKMNEYDKEQPMFPPESGDRAKTVHDKDNEKQRFRLFLGNSQRSPIEKPRLDAAKVVKGLRYGLVNVRTDGHRLFFAQLEESGGDWAYTTLSAKQISEAR